MIVQVYRVSEILERDSSGAGVELFDTELGWMALAHDDRALLHMVMGYETAAAAKAALKSRLAGMPRESHSAKKENAKRRATGAEMGETTKLDVAALIARFQAYAAGRCDEFADVPLAEGDPNSFRRRVLAACRRIPRGKTMSYGELAALVGSPGAARAVGSAMATNCVPLVVPCHRVVGSAGSLGGFSAHGGLNLKRRLLELEGATGNWADSVATAQRLGHKSAWNKLRVSARIRPRAGNSAR